MIVGAVAAVAAPAESQKPQDGHRDRDQDPGEFIGVRLELAGEQLGILLRLAVGGVEPEQTLLQDKLGFRVPDSGPRPSAPPPAAPSPPANRIEAGGVGRPLPSPAVGSTERAARPPVIASPTPSIPLVIMASTWRTRPTASRRLSGRNPIRPGRFFTHPGQRLEPLRRSLSSASSKDSSETMNPSRRRRCARTT